jgi:glycosyl transferase family 25
VRVISLARSADRRASMARQLDAVGSLDWAFFDACESLPGWLHHDPAVVRRRLRRDMTGGELGCFASHAALWRWFIDDSTAQLLVVLEDDVVIDPGFFAQLPAFAAALPNTQFVRLYAKAPTLARPLAQVMGRHIVRYRGIAFGTQGYVLRRAGAERFLASITNVERPIDDEIDRFWVHGNPNIGVHPFPIMEIGFASTIEPARRAPTSGGWLRWKLGRAGDGLQRRAANIRMALAEPRL